jgi:gamma-glutamyl:cysteine ligase YbdK (ATP-grasp superfamily)
MGQEIPHSSFSDGDFRRYQQMLEDESALLKQWFEENRFECQHPVAGCELEAWLIDDHCVPAPVNVECLEELDDEDASPELSQFNIELNFPPLKLQDSALSDMQQAMQSGWDKLRVVAKHNNADGVLCGILPTVQEKHLSPDFMSPLNRYAALNEQVLLKRGGEPIHIDIVGNQHLALDQYDVMLESATTSFQVHMQVPQSQAARYLNASMILSAPLVAVCANSPYLFGYDLWDETRIPVFEQSVASGGFAQAAHGPLKRITFGNDYVRESLWECFEENLLHYPVLLPHDFKQPAEKMAHLQLHNGTIWRWNRPLIGFINEVPHLRIEQRVIPAGPTMVDMVANMAFYYGLVESLAQQDKPPEMLLEFALARDNFYKAAKHGLNARLHWLDGSNITIGKLVLEQLLELAWQGLERLGIEAADIKQYLGVIEQRVSSGQTGTSWQREFVARHGHDMNQLLHAYCERQYQGLPVHEWDFAC